MIIVDTALEKRQEQGKPIQVGIVGAGYMGCGIALQIEKSIPGMRVAAIANRTVPKAIQAYETAGVGTVRVVGNVTELERAIEAGQGAVTDDPLLLCQAGRIDAIIEATGEVEFSAPVAVEAIRNGKHIILMNAELDATVGPLLKKYADRAGVIMTNADGDQPGVLMNLYRFVKTIGYEPVLAGNIKGLQDAYRTPETQQGFAARTGISPEMATSFADGTKVCMEMAVVANALGFKTGCRGMYGPRCDHVKEAPGLFPLDQMLQGGLVDYVLGAEPGPGVFVLGYNEHPQKQAYMNYFKMGEGPLYVFYTPYHLPHLEVPLTVARAVLFGDATIAPKNGPVCDVITLAKTDLKSGQTLDGIGGFTCYGTLENYDVATGQNLLPMGLARKCRLKRSVAKDQAITYDDVELPSGRLCDKLRAEQSACFKDGGEKVQQEWAPHALVEGS